MDALQEEQRRGRVAQIVEPGPTSMTATVIPLAPETVWEPSSTAPCCPRSRAGVAAAKRRGVKFGPKPKLTTAQIEHARRLIDDGESRQYVADLLKVGCVTAVPGARYECVSRHRRYVPLTVFRALPAALDHSFPRLLG